jgi:hypothetical protein
MPEKGLTAKIIDNRCESHVVNRVRLNSQQRMKGFLRQNSVSHLEVSRPEIPVRRAHALDEILSLFPLGWLSNS